MKTCTYKFCQQNNPQSLSNFSKDKHSSDGFCYKCKSCVKVIKKEYDKDYKKRPHIIRKDKSRLLMKNHGITIEHYDVLLLAQNYCCAICQVPQAQAGERGLVVDHNHKTNEIRALLCGRCNMGLGLFKENIDTLNKAISYLSNKRIIYELDDEGF